MWKKTGDYNVMVKINSRGLRDSKNLSDSRKDDIFVVGDSFSFGWGVEEYKRYSNILGDLLKKRVFNICIPGDIRDYGRLVLYATENGANIHNLIVGVCMENDLHYSDASAESFIASQDKRRNILPIKYWLTAHSALYNFCVTTLHQNDMLRKIAIKMGLMMDNHSGIIKNIFSKPAINSTAEELAQIVKHYNSLILIIPSRGLWIGNNTKVEEKVHHTFIHRLKELGLNVLDMKPILEEGGQPLKYHFKNDPHWNREGHIKAAKAIAHYWNSARP